MQKLLVTACVALIATVLAMPVLAEPPTQTQGGTPLMTNQPSSTTDTSIARASKLIGATVKNAQHEELGKIDNVLICPETGRVGGVIVASGGVMGLGETLYPVPYQALKVTHVQTEQQQPGQPMARQPADKTGSCQITLDISKERLEQAPQIEADDLSKFEDTEWTAQLGKFYNVTLPRAEKSDVAKPGVQTAKHLLEAVVKNDAGQEVGKCQEVVFDSNSGQIRYLALSFSTLGTGENLYAVPFESIAFASEDEQPENRYLVCNVDQTELSRHQGFTQENWPRVASETWPVRR